MTLRVENLRICVRRGTAEVDVVRGVGFEIGAARTRALVGESGCGKSLTALAIARLLPTAARIAAGSVHLDGRELTGLAEPQMQTVRGASIGFVFQDPFNSLNPVLTVGHQLVEALRLTPGVSASRARLRAAELLRMVRVPAPDARLADFPYQLSGGMRQRVVLALALARDPRLLIADEPTTALDVTVQARILELLESLRQDRGLAILLVSHDLGVVARCAHDVSVMYAGRIVESGPAPELLRAPRHPYTQALLDCRPRLDDDAAPTALRAIPGEPPDPVRFPTGCAFHPRCPRVEGDQRCSREVPGLHALATIPGRLSACWRSEHAGEPR